MSNPQQPSPKQVIFSPEAPPPIGPYSQAIRVGNIVFCSGQTPIDQSGTIPTELWDVSSQTRQAILNLQSVLTAAGCTLADVVKTSVFLKHIGDFSDMNAVYAEFFPPDQAPPARSTIEAGRLPKDALVEIDCIAVVR